MNTEKGFVDIYLHDPEGITVESVNYKIANGAKIRVPISNYPTIKLNSLTDKRQNSSVPLSTSSTLLTDIGNAGYTGVERPTITLNAYVLVSDSVPLRTGYFGATRVWRGVWDSETTYDYTASPIESKDLVLLGGNVYACIQDNTNKNPSTEMSYWELVPNFVLDYYLLFNMWLFNHRYYLTDIKPGISKTNFGTPINILMNRTDMLDRVVFSSLGVPVIINSITPSGELRFDDPTNPTEYLMGVTIELLVDN